MIVLTLFFTGTGAPCGVGYGIDNIRVICQESSAQGGLACARWRGNDKKSSL